MRAFVHRAEQIQAVESAGAEEITIGDMLDPVTVQQAVQGMHAIYHVCPNVSPDEERIGQIVIDASVSEGLDHFVYHSVLHPQVEDMPHHWLKMRVEERLFETGMPFTILQPAAYMQNILAHWEMITSSGIYPVPYAVNSHISLVDLEDVAKAAAIVLMEPGHVGATYELVGTNGMTQYEVASILSEKLGRSVRAEYISPNEWETQARASGLSDYQISTLLKMFQYYEQHGFWGNPNVLDWLLNHPPTSLATCITRHITETVPL